MAQSVERRIGSAEVTGPIPVSSCNIRDALFLQETGHFLYKKTVMNETLRILLKYIQNAVEKK